MYKVGDAVHVLPYAEIKKNSTFDDGNQLYKKGSQISFSKGLMTKFCDLNARVVKFFELPRRCYLVSGVPFLLDEWMLEPCTDDVPLLQELALPKAPLSAQVETAHRVIELMSEKIREAIWDSSIDDSTANKIIEVFNRGIKAVAEEFFTNKK